MDALVNNWVVLCGGGILGFAAGILTGLLGAGGGFIVTPVLNIFLGLPMNMAVGTSAFQVLGASAFSLYHHYEKKLFGIRVALTMLLGIPFGSYLGASIVKKLALLKPIMVAGRELKTVDFVLLLVFAVFLSLIAAWLFYDNFHVRKHDQDIDEESHTGLLSKLKIYPVMKYRTIHLGEFSSTVLVLLGFSMGFLSGLLGIGGGVVIIPILFYLVGQETKFAIKTGTMLVLACGFFATICHAFEKNIDYTLSASLITGAFFGTKIGAGIQKRLSGKDIRKYLAFVILAAVLIVIFKLSKMIF